MEIRFDRDLRHNYMVLCDLMTTGDYRLRMLAENCPQGLLRCSLRNVNGTGFLYYEIDSRQPMRNRYADGGLGADDLRRLLRAIDTLRETLEDYLLDVEHILFSADCVYTDVRTGDFLFVYCPAAEVPVFSESGAAISFGAFAEELLSFLDQEDETAARIAYTLCELAGRGDMLLRDMVQAALEEGGGDAGADKAEIKELSESDDPAAQFRPQAPRVYPEDCVKRIGEEGEVRRTETEKGRGSGWVLTVFFAAVFIGNLFLRRRFLLDARENLISLAAAGVSALMTPVSLVLWIRSGKCADKEEETEAEGETAQWVRAGYEEASLIGERRMADKERAARGYADSGSFGVYDASELSDEETTVLSEDEIPCARKLYGRNAGETINISLEHLPLTVGKLSGCADYVIRDPSISRMHTRFTGDTTGAAQMKDLNSTNGTFLNGRRLHPNETVSIRPGDEIGIGRFVFELR